MSQQKVFVSYIYGPTHRESEREREVTKWKITFYVSFCSVISLYARSDVMFFLKRQKAY